LPQRGKSLIRMVWIGSKYSEEVEITYFESHMFSVSNGAAMKTGGSVTKRR